MKSGIYKITSPSGKIYIGQSLNLKARYDNYKRHDCKRQPKIYNSINKYGFDKHKYEVIELCVITELNERERYWQEYYDSTGKKGLNCILTSTAEKKRVVSQETRKRISESNKNRAPISEDTRNKLRLKGKMVAKTEAHIKRFALYRISFKGVKMSEESRTKMSKAKKGKTPHNKGTTHRPESIQKMIVARRGKGNGAINKMSKMVLDLATGIYYESMGEACKYGCPHLPYKNFIRHINGEYATNKTTFLLLA